MHAHSDAASEPRQTLRQRLKHGLLIFLGWHDCPACTRQELRQSWTYLGCDSSAPDIWTCWNPACRAAFPATHEPPTDVAEAEYIAGVRTA